MSLKVNLSSRRCCTVLGVTATALQVTLHFVTPRASTEKATFGVVRTAGGAERSDECREEALN